MIYIYKDNQQSGPLEEHVIVDQLRAGFLSPNDKAIRHGETQWQTLGEMFPGVAAPPAAPFPAAQPPESLVDNVQYRGTLIPKLFFGLCFLLALLGLAGAGFYFYSLMGASGNLEADLSRMSYRVLARNMAVAMFVGAFFAFLALALSFKGKLIRSNGLRIALRAVFILILLSGLIAAAAGAVTYLTYTPPYRSSTPASASNDLLRALEQGEAAVGPYEMAAVLIPIGAGLFLLGLSGAMMTKRPNS